MNDYEKTIIYKYSEDYYEFVNTNFRKSKGKNIDDFSSFLIKSVKKLSDFKLLCYRSANLTSSEIKKYTSALKKKNTIIEYSFVSCSKSRLLANMFPANVTFIIHSKSAKEVEKVAKYGINSGQNEKEVIFLPNTKFEVLDIEQNEGKYVIYGSGLNQLKCLYLHMEHTTTITCHHCKSSDLQKNGHSENGTTALALQML